MVKKLTKLGNSSALILDRPIMELMEIDSDSLLKISVEGRRLVVEPVSDEDRQQQFRRSVERTGKKNAELFRRLAK